MTEDSNQSPDHRANPQANNPHASHRPDWFTRVRRSRAFVRLIWAAEQLGKLAILVTIVNYFLEAPDRLKSKEFQAWQLVNSARTGDGGRKLALHDLVQDGVDLSGLDLGGANLLGADLRGGRLSRVSFVRAFIDSADFSCLRQRQWLILHAPCKKTELEHAVFTAPVSLTSFREADLDSADFSTPGAADEVSWDSLSFVDFSGARLFAASFHNVNIWNCHFSDAILDRAEFSHVDVLATSFDRANFHRSFGPGNLVVFQNVRFTNVTFQGADLTGISFVDTAIKPPDERTIQAIVACGRGGACVPKDRPLTESDLKGALLCRTVINGTPSNRDCAAVPSDDPFIH